MKISLRLTVVCSALVFSAPLLAQVSMAPLVGFGGSDGWLSPGENGYAYLTTGASERGLDWGNNQLYLTSRANVAGNAVNVRILDQGTGADIGALTTTGISQGTFLINGVSVADDGAIYVANLSSPVSATAPFKVYRWDSNGVGAPTTAFSSTTITGGRLGDTFDVIGSGAGTVIVAGESNTGGAGARNSFAALTTGDGLIYSGGLVAFTPSTPPNGGDFRLGMTLIDSNTVIGTQGGTGIPARVADFSGLAGTLVASPTLFSITDRGMDYAVVGGSPLLATIDTANNIVRIYNMADPASPQLLTAGNNTTSYTAGGLAAGISQVRWGQINGDTATLYAMNANNGIQAFIVTVPEPSTALLLLFGALAGTFRRRR